MSDGEEDAPGAARAAGTGPAPGDAAPGSSGSPGPPGSPGPSGSPGTPEPAGSPLTVAQKIDRLWRTMSPRGREYTYAEVAEAINARAQDTGGPTVSHTTLWNLRTGRVARARADHLQALAAFFGVPADYFFDDRSASAVDADLEMVRLMKDAGIRRVAMRASGLSPVTLRAVLAQIEALREVEGLPSEGDPPGPTGTGGDGPVTQ